MNQRTVVYILYDDDNIYFGFQCYDTEPEKVLGTEMRRDYEVWETNDFIRFVHGREFCGRPRMEPAHRSDRHCVDTEKTIYRDLLGIDVTDAAETSLQPKMETQSLPVPLGGDFVVINPGFSGLGRRGYRCHRAS